MKVVPTAIEGVVILEPEVFGDARGYFFESYSQRRFDAEVRPVRFVQDNESHSRYRLESGPRRCNPLAQGQRPSAAVGGRGAVRL